MGNYMYMHQSLSLLVLFKLADIFTDCIMVWKGTWFLFKITSTRNSERVYCNGFTLSDVSW